jgi:hypothetical protein
MKIISLIDFATSPQSLLFENNQASLKYFLKPILDETADEDIYTLILEREELI